MSWNTAIAYEKLRSDLHVVDAVPAWHRRRPDRPTARHVRRGSAAITSPMSWNSSGAIVFHTGPRAFPLDERVSAVPICAIWHS
jgi:hypothetical protein